jgi:DNA-binding transcriptional regulator YiaG
MLNPAHLRALLARQRLTHARAAALLGVGRVCVTHWCTGKRTVPGPASRLLNLLDSGMITPETLATLASAVTSPHNQED